MTGTRKSVRAFDVSREIARILGEDPGLRQLTGLLESPGGRITLSGLAGSSKTAVIAHLRRTTGRGILLVTPRMEDAIQLASDLGFWAGEKTVHLFPDPEIVPYGIQSAPDEVAGERIRALVSLRREPRSVVVASAGAVMRYLPPPEALLDLSRKVAVGDRGEPRELALQLVQLGYERGPAVEELGQFSLRGGIVDVFPHLTESPVRIEFGESGVESIRQFNTATQRSLGALDALEIAPRREILPPGEGTERTPDRVMDALRELDSGRSKDLAIIAEAISRGAFFEGIEWMRPFFFPEGRLLFDYAAADRIVVLDEPHRLRDMFEETLERAAAIHEERRTAHHFAFLPEALFATFERFEAGLGSRQVLEFSLLPHPAGERSIVLDSRTAEPFGSNLNLLREWLRRTDRRATRIFILSQTRVQADRLAEVLGDEADEVTVGLGTLSSGFGLPAAGLELLTDREIYGRVHQRRTLPRFRGTGAIRDHLSLNRGDYVVHVHHGIGRYLGTEKVSAGDQESECLIIAYAEGDRVLVPLSQLHLLEKYSAPDGPAPKLSRIGTAAWEKTKTRVKAGLKEMAHELTSLYAARHAQPGHAFGPDTPWQKELESSFPFEETPDQRKATDAVKQDMESPRPMDRLVCGDVGYGKTEIAVRAAFKAVMEGKQVALLVPTTLLAQQHLGTFSERLRGYPVRIEMMSRFRSPREQKQVGAELAAGKVDLLIGTHRILSKDIRFRDLGLVIIDEEHRFGVGHKEQLKKMRTVVDVLTLTATPIPRTLHLSLMGARDLTVIETPPPNRLAIHTEIVPFDREVISGAILKEIERGGQVFFVHNRVQSIYSMANYLQGLLPQLRVGIAHGQMNERDLERVMMDFVDLRHDILVSTMIIESGLDMPRVNTLVVNRADRMGLAQLYQLRGRVGRSAQRAYAYLLLPPNRRVTEDAEKRLAILAESTELGSGMRLALRDLEIRGAGNILGADQHGFMIEIGWELYSRLLEDAVREVRGEVVAERREVRVDTDLSALLPGDYVEDSGERVATYRRLIRMQKLEELADLTDELRDRFGTLPREARNLLGLQRVRLRAEEAGIEELRLRRNGLSFRFGAAGVPSRQRLESLVAGVSYPIRFSGRDGLTVDISMPPGDPDERIAWTEKCILSLGTPS